MSMPSATEASTDWRMLVATLPGQNQNARMRLWRGLKSAGAAALRDGVYVLPATPASAGLLQALADDVVGADGSADLLRFAAADPAQQQRLLALFDRTADYAALLPRAEALQANIGALAEGEARRQLAALRRDADAVAAIDFFPGAAREQLQTRLADLERAINAVHAPDEPQAASGEIERLDPAKFQRRLWATRRRLWIDRVASAWLIRRWIDREARFRWLAEPQDCPARALGFDFDGARFTHRGSRVTFEVLAASFGLDADPGIARLGALVHYLDVGGIAVPEAAGFAAIMAGARATHADDDALLAAMTPVLDSLHAAYAERPPTPEPSASPPKSRGRAR